MKLILKAMYQNSFLLLVSLWLIFGGWFIAHLWWLSAFGVVVLAPSVWLTRLVYNQLKHDRDFGPEEIET